MVDNQYITMIVCWNDQRRPIEININDDLNAIENSISNTYQLQQVTNLYKYQIQYYDNDYENFMDLYPASFNSFQKLLSKLLLPEAPPKNSKEWVLKIIPRTIETMRSKIHQPITDDTYNYQQENDQNELVQHEESLLITNNIQTSLVSIESRTNNPENLVREPMPQHNDEDQQETVQSNNQSPKLSVVNSQLLITSDHRYGLEFVGKLADHQRRQYESEMTRVTSSRSTMSGCLLRACQRPNITDGNAKQTPAVHFEIPVDKYNALCELYFYILTEADKNDAHYLHASKGIYDHSRKCEDISGRIPNSKSFNPYVVQLSQDHLRDGIYEIFFKICNIRHLPEHKHKQLRDFARINSREAYDDSTLLSEKTTCTLKFSNEKYHLGCILFCDGIPYDRCISSLTMAVPSRKRNDNNQSRQRDDERQKKKIKRE